MLVYVCVYVCVTGWAALPGVNVPGSVKQSKAPPMCTCMLVVGYLAGHECARQCKAEHPPRNLHIHAVFVSRWAALQGWAALPGANVHGVRSRAEFAHPCAVSLGWAAFPGTLHAPGVQSRAKPPMLERCQPLPDHGAVG
eukprot:1153080-Pelagomonas_calceolata.AAC.6